MSSGISLSAPDGGEARVPAVDSDGRRPGRFDRRRFIQYLMNFSIVSSLAIVVTPIIGFLIPTKSASGTAGGRVLAGTLETLPIGSGAVVAVGSKPAIVVNTVAGVKAYSAICTHLGCIVLWDETAGAIICPCHDGWFNPANGAVMSGPPPAPLASLTTAVEGSEIYIVTG